MLLRLFLIIGFFVPAFSAAAIQEAEGGGDGDAHQVERYIYSPERIAVWLENFRTQALEAGVSGVFFDKAFENFKPDEKVIAAANYQPEFTMPKGEYVERLVSDIRIQNGRKLLLEKAPLFEKLERLYGVDRHILVAIWGIETNYGTTMGGHNAIYALATLAIEGKRQKFAQKQLLALLPVLEKDNLPIDGIGSWAGAMGHMQFIPTTYVDYARDVDGDGKRDIWHSLEDSLGSAAYYIKRSGWVAGMFWGMEVNSPNTFSFENKNDDKQKIESWIDDGYVPAFGKDARYQTWNGADARLIKIAPHAPAFLATKNFDVLLKYNRSVNYVLAVGHLADRLRGAPKTTIAWVKAPLEAFTAEKIKQGQTSLQQLGFDVGKLDGIIGRKTRAAFNLWQESVGLKKAGLSQKELTQLNRQAGLLTPEEIKQLQENLALLDFEVGIADGLVGAKTRSALKAFQKDWGFVVNGEPSRAMLNALQEKIKQREAQSAIIEPKP